MHEYARGRKGEDHPYWSLGGLQNIFGARTLGMGLDTYGVPQASMCYYYSSHGWKDRLHRTDEGASKRRELCRRTGMGLALVLLSKCEHLPLNGCSTLCPLPICIHDPPNNDLIERW